MTKGDVPWRFQRHATIDSTQRAALDAACRGEPGRLAILADTQTAGRGRNGRGWSAPSGNLNLSFLLRPAKPPDPGGWALHAGVALYETLADYTDGLMLKWPNDVLLNGNKVAGILIDSAVDALGNLDWVVVGAGANLLEAPNVKGRVTACLPQPGPEAVLVAKAFLDNWDRWAGADVRSAWLCRAHQAGTEMDVLTEGGRVRGRFAGLSLRGELVLEGASRPISSAEVFLELSAGRSQTAPCFSS